MYLRFLSPPPHLRPEHIEVSNRVSANIAPHPKLNSTSFFVDEIFPTLVRFQTFTLQSSAAFRSCGFVWHVCNSSEDLVLFETRKIPCPTGNRNTISA